MEDSASGVRIHSVPVSSRAVLAFAMAVLFGMNLLNYIDRYVFAAVGPAIMRDLSVSSGRFGLFGSSFMLVYTLVAPLMGWMGDRYHRRRLLTFGVGLWSVATVGTAFAQSETAMFLARAVLGIGEASYGVVAPTLLADLFPRRRRGRVMGLFYLAMPLGTALGYGLGGVIESQYGWRAAFLVVGAPGLLLALLGLLIHDPGRGASEGPVGHTPARPRARDYLGLLTNRSYLYNTIGMAAVTFTTGAFGYWMPTFYQLVRQMPPKDNLLLGLPLAIGGIVGVLVGMWVPDFLLKYTPRAYLLWASIAVLAAIPSGVAGLLDPERISSLSLMFVSCVFLTSCLGPCNTVTANVVPASQRAVGYAVSIFVLHLLGDMPSPTLIGEAADALARPDVALGPLRAFCESLGATSISSPSGPTNLTGGMLLIIPVLVLGSLSFYLGSRHLAADQERAHHH